VATGDPGSEYAFYYLWATLYAVCVFNARQIALQGVWVCLAYALSLALIGERPAGALVAQWMLPVATLLAAGTLVRQLTGRLRRSEALLRHDAGHDALTGLPNRAHFDALLEDALVVGAPVAVAFIDLDDFKRVNDSLGHGAGDALLLAVARRLGDQAAEGTVIARFGGDEFLALIRGEAADAEARTLIESFAQPFLAGVHEITVKASLGLAQARPGEDAETVLRHADTAVYEAKRGGRGGSATFDASMRAAISERRGLEHDLARALSHDELEVAYQPIVSLDDGSITGVEALARWTHPERGRVAPDAFIAVAEETGLIDALGEQVLAIACTDAVAWAEAIPGFRVSVNLSPRQLDTDAFGPMVIRTLARTGLPCRALQLEVTETSVMSDRPCTRENLRAIARSGIGLALDDFGTGFSSLSYLSELEFDAIKLDRCFIGGAPSPARDAIVAAVASIGTATGARVIAEGVETAQHHERALALGCGYGQGLHFGRPMPAAELDALVLRYVGGSSISPSATARVTAASRVLTSNLR
jgi:diguanylate cyclase (GGDEF)-like protein